MPESRAQRIGYVLKVYPRFSETFILNEVLALEAAGAQLEIFSLRPPVDGRFHEALAEVRAPVSYIPLHHKAAEVWSTLRAGLAALPALPLALPLLLQLPVDDAAQAVLLADRLRQSGITHLHAHFGSMATSVARAAAELAGVTYSFTAHAKDIFHESVDVEELGRKLGEASVVVTVSDFNLEHLRRVYGAAADRVVRIYNGLDLTRYRYTSPVHRPAVVTGVGRLVEKKGFCHLIDAIAELVEAGREIRLDLVGTGDQEAALRAQVSALGIEEHVRFCGPLPQAQTRTVISEAAVLAAPCIVGEDGNRDGLPTVLLEAMALGTPCVATPVTGIPEAVQADVTGLLVPEADPSALATTIARLLDEPPLRRRLAENARALVEREFDVHRNSSTLLELLNPNATLDTAVA